MLGAMPLPCPAQHPPSPISLSQDHGGLSSFSSWTSAPKCNSGINCLSLPSTRVPVCEALANWIVILPTLLSTMHQDSISMLPLVCQLNAESMLVRNASVDMGGRHDRSFTLQIILLVRPRVLTSSFPARDHTKGFILLSLYSASAHHLLLWGSDRRRASRRSEREMQVTCRRQSGFGEGE